MSEEPDIVVLDEEEDTPPPIQPPSPMTDKQKKEMDPEKLRLHKKEQAKFRKSPEGVELAEKQAKARLEREQAAKTLAEKQALARKQAIEDKKAAFDPLKVMKKAPHYKLATTYTIQGIDKEDQMKCMLFTTWKKPKRVGLTVEWAEKMRKLGKLTRLEHPFDE